MGKKLGRIDTKLGGCQNFNPDNENPFQDFMDHFLDKKNKHQSTSVFNPRNWGWFQRKRTTGRRLMQYLETPLLLLMFAVLILISWYVFRRCRQRKSRQPSFRLSAEDLE